VLLDMFLERGAAFDASFSVIDASNVATYTLRGEYDGRYWFYASSDMRIDRDTFAGLDAFDMRQEQVPIASGLPVITFSDMPPWTTGEWIQTRWADRDEVAPIYAVDFGARTITIRGATTRQTPGMSHRRHVKRAPDPRAKPSRVPPLPTRRLDGRRR